MLRHRQPEPGEWQTDESGRRFRMLGNAIKEYEMTLHTASGLDIPYSMLDDYNRMEHESREKQRAAEMAQLKKTRHSICPLSLMAGAADTSCKGEDCALFDDDACTLSSGTARKDTAGLKCPLDCSGRPCQANCELYKKGCTLTASARKRTI